MDTLSPEKHFFECMCGHSVLSVSRDEWDEYTDYVALLIYGEDAAGWKDRLRHAWSIIKYGHPWGATELLLRVDEAQRLGQLLLAKLEEAEKRDPSTSRPYEEFRAEAGLT